MTQQQLDQQYQALLDRDVHQPDWDSLVLPVSKPKVLGQGTPYENGNLILNTVKRRTPKFTGLHPYQFTQVVNLIRTNDIVRNNFKLFAKELKTLINNKCPGVNYTRFSQLTQQQQNTLKAMVLKNYRSI
jgi:hypothetical protein